jgi:hypothetical protein
MLKASSHAVNKSLGIPNSGWGEGFPSVEIALIAVAIAWVVWVTVSVKARGRDSMLRSLIIAAVLFAVGGKAFAQPQVVSKPNCTCGQTCDCPPGGCPTKCPEWAKLGFHPAPKGFHWEKYPSGQWGHVQDGAKPQEVKPAPALPFVPTRPTITTVPTRAVPIAPGKVLSGSSTPTVLTLTGAPRAVQPGVIGDCVGDT